MDLGGMWQAAASDDELRRVMADPDLDDSGWEPIAVPGHWRSSSAFCDSDGPIAYRRRFEAPPPEAGRRAFLTFDGVFYQTDVWLDGDYIGDTEGYFFPHTFEVTALLGARGDHVLAVEVACARPDDRARKRNLTGVFQHWDCIDPDWNPGGIWAPVRLRETGQVWIRSLKVLCPDATAETATLDFEAELDTPVATGVTVVTRVALEGREPGSAAASSDTHALAFGRNTVRWRVAVDEPELWWPHSLGEQPLYAVSVEVFAGDQLEPSDSRSLKTGLRQVRLRNFIATVNGERIFLKGANYGPAKRALAEVTASDFERDLLLAHDAGLDLLRVHAHVSRAELYEVADRTGMLLWQDMPLQWGYGQVRRQAVLQSRRAVELLGHHPSIAVWCGHNEPLAIDFDTGASLTARNVARVAAGQVLPTWNKTILDRSIRRALEQADPSRAVVAHSGVAPHPAWGTDSHFYFGWYHGEERDFPGMVARLPVLARFVSEFGAQAVPDTAGFVNPEKWPYLDWDEMEAHFCLQKSIFDQRVPPGEYATFEAWREATQQYQATVLRHHIETLRRLKYRPAGGFCLFTLTDSQPAISWSILDYERVPKLAYKVVADACAPVIVAADRLGRSYSPGAHIGVDVHAVSDLRAPVEGAEATATLRWPGGERTWRFSGDIPADSCARIGRVSDTIPSDTPPGEVHLDLRLRWDDGEAHNSYASRVS
jgi:beta-mannosidase